MIEAHGGKNLAAVSANTSYLLAGDKIGPAKLQKAQKLGIAIISEDDFERMIADRMVGGNPSDEAEDTGLIPDATTDTTKNPAEENSGQPQQGTLF